MTCPFTLQVQKGTSTNQVQKHHTCGACKPGSLTDHLMKWGKILVTVPSQLCQFSLDFTAALSTKYDTVRSHCHRHQVKLFKVIWHRYSNGTMAGSSI